MSSENRLLGADFLRAAACLTVLFHHLAQRLDLNRDFGPVLNFYRAFAQMGTFGVAMFFVLSGFLLARPFWVALDQKKPMPSLKIYTARRAARILPGVWLALVVSFILSITVFNTSLDGALVLRFLAGFFLVADWHWLTFFPVEPNGPLWSISFEATSYVLLPIGFLALFALPASGRPWTTRLAWLAVIGLTLLAHWLFLTYFPIDRANRGWDFGNVGGAKYWMPRYNPFGFFAMFALGGLAAGLQVQLSRFRHLVFDALSMAAMAAAVWVILGHLAGRGDASGFGWLGIPYAFPWFQLTLAAFLAVTPSSVWVGRLLDNPLSRSLATISFGIYIWHNLVIELVRLWWVPGYYYGNIRDTAEYLIVSGTIFGISVLLGLLSWRLVEYPVIRWAREHEMRSRSRLVPQAAE